MIISDRTSLVNLVWPMEPVPPLPLRERVGVRGAWNGRNRCPFRPNPPHPGPPPRRGEGTPFGQAYSIIDTRLNRGQFKQVFEAIEGIQDLQAKSSINQRNMEEVFATFEMGQNLGRFPRLKPEQTAELRDAMRMVIAHTIEETVKFPLSLSNNSTGLYTSEQVGIPRPYEEFANLVRFLRTKARPTRRVSVITFNYDIAVDFALHMKGLKVDYALSDGLQDAVPLLKLHGSISWASCPCVEGDHITALSMGKCFAGDRDALPPPFPKNISWRTLEQLTDLPCSRCGKLVTVIPTIVPPTWNKEDHYRKLSSVWARAATELADARDIFIIGYSLPPSDTFFRYFYGLGTSGGPLLDRLWVFNPDASVRTRFEKLLGSGVGQSFDLKQVPFNQALSLIRHEFE